MKISYSLSFFIHIFSGVGKGRHNQWLIIPFFFLPFTFFLTPQIWAKSQTQFPAILIGGCLEKNRCSDFYA
jgi:hypothetical protein